MAIAQVLPVHLEAEPAPSPVIDLPVRRHTSTGWRSRCLATGAYLLTLVGLIAVATLSADGNGSTAPDAPATQVAVATP